LPLDQPGVAEEPALLNERVEVKSLRRPLERLGSVHVGWLLLLRGTLVVLVVLEIVKAIPPKDRGERQRRRLIERITVDPQFALIPQTVSERFPQNGKHRPWFPA
jgi:hypothetical protein